MPARPDFAARLPAIVLALAATAAAGAFVPLLHPDVRTSLVVATGAVVALPVVVVAARRRFDPFEPIFIFALAYAAMFVVRPAAMILGDNFKYVRPTRSIDISGTFEQVQALALVGAAGLMAGYYVPLGRKLAARLRRPPAALHADTAVVGGIAVGAAGVLLFGLFLLSVGGFAAVRSFLAGRDVSQVALYRNSTGYLYTGPFLLIPAALLLYATARTRRNAGLTFVAAVFATLLLLQSAPIGGRIAILPLVGSLAVYHYVSRGTRPGTLMVVVAALAALTVSNVLLLSRNVNDPGYANAFGNTLRHPANIFKPITEQPDAEMDPALAAVIAAGSADGGSQYGWASAGEVFVRPIPRLLWPGKPLPPRQQIIAETWPAEYRAGIANPEFSILLYFFLDFSFAGALAGMFILGVLGRALYEYLNLRPGNLVAQLVFSALVPFIPILLRDSPTDTIIKLAFAVAPLLVVCRLAAVREPVPALETPNEPQAWPEPTGHRTANA